MLGVLILGWFLTLFNVDTLLVSGLNELLGTSFSTNIYWLIIIVIALIVYIVRKTQN